MKHFLSNKKNGMTYDFVCEDEKYVEKNNGLIVTLENNYDKVLHKTE
ncbi:hypothetical protein [Soonwooa sp.]|nr:hypothetical protein [Soonwooa sp.]